MNYISQLPFLMLWDKSITWKTRFCELWEPLFQHYGPSNSRIPPEYWVVTPAKPRVQLTRDTH